MAVHVRKTRRADIADCGAVMYEALKAIAEQHGFPPPHFPSPEATSGLLATMLEAPGFDAMVAEEDGKIVGSIFVSQRSRVGGISVITIDPRRQDCGLGRQLMQRGMATLQERGKGRQQLIQAAYHNRSLCLYAKLGFVATEMLSNMEGAPVEAEIPDRGVRPARRADIAACNELCRKVHGFDRAGELANAIEQGTAKVVESGGCITGYASDVGFLGHGVGESNEDLKALIASSDEFSGPGILIPTGNGELLRWCLSKGLKLRQQMILMDTVPSDPPKGPHWPAILC